MVKFILAWLIATFSSAVWSTLGALEIKSSTGWQIAAVGMAQLYDTHLPSKSINIAVNFRSKVDQAVRRINYGPEAKLCFHRVRLHVNKGID